MFLQYCVNKKINFEDLKIVTQLKNYNKIKFKSHVSCWP